MNQEIDEKPEKWPENHIIDFSFLEMYSQGDQGFINEMIRLFLKTIPQDLANLEMAILLKDAPKVAGLAHHMKSSMAMFRLDKEVAFLAETENNALVILEDSKFSEQFSVFKNSIIAVIHSLSTGSNNT